MFEALEQANEYDIPTVQWIQAHSLYLTDFTSQKISRSLNELIDMGLVKKGKCKSGRMMYRLMSQVIDMGISLEEDD